jgi:ATP-dependent Clp protease ATP-binding subunit ClpA
MLQVTPCWCIGNISASHVLAQIVRGSAGFDSLAWNVQSFFAKFFLPSFSNTLPPIFIFEPLFEHTAVDIVNSGSSFC